MTKDIMLTHFSNLFCTQDTKDACHVWKHWIKTTGKLIIHQSSFFNQELYQIWHQKLYLTKNNYNKKKLV